ncbi:FAD-dependent oxidoreductase [Bradyrhizobium sp. SYSU BS000235]|uniref:FAD-dependent oxidoreductase n=1 Tax=Bradyrhizobium sp. SYSU BS000235 TaxID=3411332 RepID=UPI003C73E71C
MRQADIAIVGGGLAGSTAAAMLGRAGISAILIDPHNVYPPDFRCEKLDSHQVGILRKTGLAEPVLRAATLDNNVWVARLGRLLDKRRPSDQNGIFYDTLVNTVRNEIPAGIEFIEAKVTGIKTSTERQTLTLSNGEEIITRLVVLANGLNIGLRHSLGIEREITSPCHSITVGFNLTPVGRDKFEFPALTYFTENSAAQMSYLTLFPIGSVMRANLMVYRTMEDPWLRRMRRTPEDALHEIMPHLRALTGDFKVEGDIKIRPADLYVTKGHLQAGIVLVGDAFATSCPAAGTGTGKVFTDVERLCNVYIPAWLKTPGMGLLKISQFYDDPEKRACDEESTREAYNLRSMSIDTGLSWHVRRWIRFAVRLGMGLLRSLRETTAVRRTAQP